MTAIPPIDPRRLAEVDSSLALRGVLCAIAAVPLTIFTLGWSLLSIAGLAGAKDGMTVLAGALVLILGGGLPGLVTAYIVWRAVANFRLRARLGLLRGAVASGSARTAEDLGRTMGLSARDADATLREAMARGVFLSPFAFAAQPPPGIRSDAPPAPSAQPGDWIGRTVRGVYRIEAELGRGGMGAVYRARHLPTGIACAFKVLFASPGDMPDLLRRFEREATVSRAVVHPGLVRVDDFGLAEDGTPYLVMELLEGESLEARLERQGVLPWQEAVRITRAVGEALGAVHRAGLLHRDVKPSNVMLARAVAGERVVLVDLGLARRVEASPRSRLTSTGAVIGTPLYLSPEQARGEPLDERSDLYALAVVTYEMIAGVPPFFDRTLAAVYARLLNESAPSLALAAPPDLPPAVDHALARALQTRREDRFATVADLLAALPRA